MGLRGVGVVVVLGFLLAFHTDVRANKATQIAGESVPGELVEYLEHNDVIQIMLNAGLESRRRLQSASPETLDYYLPWPAGKSLYVIQGNNSSPTHFGKFRYAWDFTQDETGTEKGHPIVAVANGIVRVADYQVGADGYGWGWYVVIEHQEPDGTPKYSLYAHLKVIDPGVQANQSIRRGEPVGKLGETGTAALVNVAHLHFQFMDAIWEGDTTARSVPGSFKDIGGDGIPKEGEWYKSQNSPPPGPAPPAQTSTVLVMDVSGSMDWSQPGGGRKIEAAKTAASRFLEMIRAENEVGGPYHQVAVVSFTDEATLDLPLSSDIDHAERVLSLFQPVEGTNMAQALRLAISELHSNERGTKPTIVLLSDGVPTVSLSGETSADIETLKGEVLTIAQEALDNYCIYAVGFGDPNETGRSGGILVPSLDPEFLTQVASTTDCGQYYSALDGYNLQNIYIALRHQSIGTIVGETLGRVSHGETAMLGKSLLSRVKRSWVSH